MKSDNTPGALSALHKNSEISFFFDWQHIKYCFALKRGMAAFLINWICYLNYSDLVRKYPVCRWYRHIIVLLWSICKWLHIKTSPLFLWMTRLDNEHGFFLTLQSLSTDSHTILTDQPAFHTGRIHLFFADWHVYLIRTSGASIKGAPFNTCNLLEEGVRVIKKNTTTKNLRMVLHAA